MALPLNESFWQLLRSKQDSLTKSGRIIAEYLSQNAQQAQYWSISVLASQCGVAEATISRFCRALGFDSYNEMRIALARANASVDPPVGEALAPGVNTSTLCRHAGALAVKAINDASSAMAPEAVDRAAALLQRAKQVFCFGQGSSQLLANDIWARFSTLSTKFHTAGDNHMQAITASLMAPEDVIFFVSYSGATRDMMETLRLAKANGASVILLTHGPNVPGAALADVVLPCGDVQSPLDGGSLPAKIAMLFAAEVLVMRYTVDNQELASIAQVRTKRALAPKQL